ncbi:hypothetical protein ES703_62779 [subsurface metagenome]
MAHKYSSFYTAFSAFKGEYAFIKQRIGWALANAQGAAGEWDCDCGGSSIGYVAYAAECNALALQHLVDSLESNPDQSHLYESIYWATKLPPAPAEFELTYIKICEAWAANDFQGRGLTIAFIDRMRQLAWNETFNVQWAARPTVPEG